MKANPSFISRWLASAAALVGTATVLTGGTFVSDFNSGLPSGDVLGSGGYTNSGFCELTPDLGKRQRLICDHQRPG